jgi:hypothetical protein
MSIQNGQLLYHLTDIENIRDIIENGLLSRSSLERRGLPFTDVADQEILEFRCLHNLNRYVPFHFFAKNPFDGRVQKDNPGIEFVYLCIKRTAACNMGFKIIPRHPLNMFPFKIFDYNEGIEYINWTTMEIRDYTNIECKEICMAESIYLGDLSIESFFCIYVYNQESKEYIESILGDNEVTNVYVNVQPNLFVRN